MSLFKESSAELQPSPQGFVHHHISNSCDSCLSTDTEIYFSRSFGFAILFIAIIGLFFTGVIPLSSSISEPLTLNNNDPKAPYALPVIWIMTLFHGTCLIYNYVRWVGSQQVGYTLGAVGSGGLAAVGIWLLVFGATPSHLSKRTGADKRMTGFPFQNTAAYDKKKDKKMG